MTQEEMHELLVKTRNALAERGHTKNQLFDSLTNRVCLIGARNLATTGSPLDWTPSGPSEEFARILGFPCEQSAITWNNEKERTEEEVLARLDEAIAKTAPEPTLESSNFSLVLAAGQVKVMQ